MGVAPTPIDPHGGAGPIADEAQPDAVRFRTCTEALVSFFGGDGGRRKFQRRALRGGITRILRQHFGVSP